VLEVKQMLVTRDEPNGILRFVGVVTGQRDVPGLGGLRLSRWPGGDAEMIADCLLLASAMQTKAAFAGLPFTGGKCCVELMPGADERTAFEAVGRHVAGFEGRLLTTADMGMDAQKLAWMSRTAPGLVLGVQRHTATATALGVFAAIRAVARFALGTRERLDAVSVLVSGVGNVGARVVAHLLDAGASVLVHDIDPVRLAPFRDRPRVKVLEGEGMTAEADPFDIFCPCATGGILGIGYGSNMPRLRAIVGAANNQLVQDEVALDLYRRQILYVPDFVANAGGLISVAAESLGQDDAWIERRARGIGERVTMLLEEALARKAPPLGVAYEIAARRQQAGAEACVC
jgi:leucine dehydrogenase